jgi:hypothetical protein
MSDCTFTLINPNTAKSIITGTFDELKEYNDENPSRFIIQNNKGETFEVNHIIQDDITRLKKIYLRKGSTVNCEIKDGFYRSIDKNGSEIIGFNSNCVNFDIIHIWTHVDNLSDGSILYQGSYNNDPAYSLCYLMVIYFK